MAPSTTTRFDADNNNNNVNNVVNDDDEEEEDVPYFLMPVAAILGMYALISFVWIVYVVYVNYKRQQQQSNNSSTTTISSERQKQQQRSSRRRKQQQQQQQGGVGGGEDDDDDDDDELSWIENSSAPVLLSREFVLLILSWFLAWFAYAFFVGFVETALDKYERSLYNPYHVLGLDPTSSTSTSSSSSSSSSNSHMNIGSMDIKTRNTLLKTTFRELSKKYHPDRGGNHETYEEMYLAYRALVGSSSSSSTSSSRSNTHSNTGTSGNNNNNNNNNTPPPKKPTSNDIGSMARYNYQVYGHPRGRLRTKTFYFKLWPPKWMYTIPPIPTVSSSAQAPLGRRGRIIQPPRNNGGGTNTTYVIVTWIMISLYSIVLAILTFVVLKFTGWMPNLTTSSDKINKKDKNDNNKSRSLDTGKDGGRTSGGGSGSNDSNNDSAGVGPAADNVQTLTDTKTVSKDDIAYLVQLMRPSSTHMDVLMTVISTPENQKWSLHDIERVNKLRQERLAKIKEEEEEKRKKIADMGFGGSDDDMNLQRSGTGGGNVDAFDNLMDTDGWDDGGDDDDYANYAGSAANQETIERERAAARAEAERTERLRQATGRPTIQLLEGIDDGVLGQKWVENTLSQINAWPPSNTDHSIMKIILNPPTSNKKKGYKNSVLYQNRYVDLLDHPGLRRILCMTYGRLNSYMLNTHPELLEAGSKKLIDQTYFKSSMEFRSRVGILMEASLRIAMSLRSFRLVSTIIETVAMFKVGCKRDMIQQFNIAMQRQYNCLPRLIVKASAVGNCTNDNDNNKQQNNNNNNNNNNNRLQPGQSTNTTPPAIPTDDVIVNGTAEFYLDLERVHAENFLREKLSTFQRQGIPPQVALSGYREGWWFLLRMERIDGDCKTVVEPINRNTPMMAALDLSDDIMKLYEQEHGTHYLLTAWPMIVQNIAQKTGKVKIQFKAPSIPGKYRFYMNIKSQDFLDADREIYVDANVIMPPTKKTTSTTTSTTTGGANAAGNGSHHASSGSAVIPSPSNNNNNDDDDEIADLSFDTTTNDKKAI